MSAAVPPSLRYPELVTNGREDIANGQKCMPNIAQNVQAALKVTNFTPKPWPSGISMKSRWAHVQPRLARPAPGPGGRPARVGRPAWPTPRLAPPKQPCLPRPETLPDPPHSIQTQGYPCAACVGVVSAPALYQANHCTSRCLKLVTPPLALEEG